MSGPRNRAYDQQRRVGRPVLTQYAPEPQTQTSGAGRPPDYTKRTAVGEADRPRYGDQGGRAEGHHYGGYSYTPSKPKPAEHKSKPERQKVLGFKKVEQKPPHEVWGRNPDTSTSAQHGVRKLNPRTGY